MIVWVVLVVLLVLVLALLPSVTQYPKSWDWRRKKTLKDKGWDPIKKG